MDAVVASEAGRGTEQLPSLADVGRSIGRDIATLIEVPAGDQQPVAGSAIYDPAASAPRFPGAIALAVGLRPSGESLPGQLQELKDAGYVALAYKAHGEPDAAIRAAAQAAGLALFLANDSVPWDRLTEFFHAAVLPAGESRRALVDIRPGDLFELANTVAALAGGAVAIADPDQTVLAYSTLAEQPIDETRRRSILQLHVPHTDQNDEDYRRVHASREVVGVAPGELSMTRSAVAIRAGNVVLGSLWLIDADSAADADTSRVLLEAANVAALHLLHRRTNHDEGRARHLDLVKPLLFEPARAELAAMQLAISAETIQVAALAASGRTGSAPESLRSSVALFDTVHTACAVWLPGAVCGLADNIVYIVLPQASGSSPAFQKEALTRIAHHARRIIARPVLVGVGSTVPVLAAEQSRLDSEAVLALLLRDADDGRVQLDSADVVADQQSLGPRLALRNMVSALRSSGHLPGALSMKIAHHDARRNTRFEETIRTYLDCNSNAIESASRLGLHANTVRYRLSRVEPLFGVRLDDPESRLLIWLQLSAKQL